MSAEHDFEWFLQHQEAYDSLTVEQVHALGRGELVAYGETKPAKAAEDSSGSPAAAEDEAKKAADEAAAKAEAEAATAKKEDPVILAKDGKNTIPFSELEESRAKAAQFEALARDQAALIEDLKAAKVADKGTGATDAQDEVMKQFKENYPELAEMLAPAVQKMIDAGRMQRWKPLKPGLQQRLPRSKRQRMTIPLTPISPLSKKPMQISVSWSRRALWPSGLRPCHLTHARQQRP